MLSNGNITMYLTLNSTNKVFYYQELNENVVN